MTIYLDIVLAENLCMNYIILLATGFIMKIKIKHKNLIISALIGAIYAILAYMDIFPLPSNTFIKIIVSICMAYIAFVPKSIKGLLKTLILFYLICFAFGGCAFALLYFIMPQDIFIRDGVYIGTYPIKIALLGGVVGFAITYVAFKVVKNKINKKSLIYCLEITVEGKTIQVNAMLDTGNMLKDPITQTPVVVVEKSKLEQLLPKSILERTEVILGGEWQEDEEALKYRARFKIIPFSSIGKQNGMLLGFKVDKVKVITDINEIVCSNIIVGIYDKKLSRSNTYSALIGLDILERSEENEYFTNVKV